MKKNYVFLTLMCLMFLNAFAQHKHQHIGGSCGSDHVNNQYFQNNPQAAAERDAFDAQLAQMAKMGKKFSSKNAQELYEIPIVVHIIHDGEDVGVGSNISDQQVINWVNYTNAVFAGTAVGVVNESSGGTTIPVKLVLAKRTEACTPTNGIVRANASGLSGYSANGLAFSSSPLGASEASIRNLSRWNPEAYYNVYLVKTITGTIGDTPLEVGGYAYSPNGSNEVYGTFMRVSTAVVGDITFPHEMAHSLGIHHTFQGTDSLGTDCPPIETDCNLEGDMICDTERIKSMASTYPIPSNSVINPCTGVNYANTQYNIMGYGSVNDRFTPEQKERAIAQLLQFRSGLLTSLGATEIDSNATPLALTPMCVPNSISIPGNYSIGPVKVTFGDLNVDSSPFRIGGEFYTDYSQSCLLNPTATIAGYEATELGIAIIGTNSQKLRAYIDWNNDGVFDAATETIYSVDSVTGITSPNNTSNVLPPVYAVKNTPLRLRVIADLNSVTITPCYNPTYGQVEDYAVIVQETIQGCNGITSAIVASISENTATSGTQINLSATGVLGSDGVQYQWQKSTTGTGDWQNIASATSLFSIVTIEGSIGSTLYYRLKVKCVETQIESFSSVVSVEIIPNYCSGGTTYAGSLLISNVSFAGINNSSVATLGYENFSAISTDIQVGSTIAFSASSSQPIIYSNDKLNVWIDLNYDGDFDDEGELVLVKNGGSFSGNITIPSNTSLGKKRMRIRVQREIGGYVSNYTPCGNADLGQVEDYTINIIDAGCNGIPEVIPASISSTQGIAGSNINLSVADITGVNGIGFQWQKSSTGTSGWENIQNATTKNATITAESVNGIITYYRVSVKCVETQIENFSNVVSFEVTPNYCTASAIATSNQKIGNVTFGNINNSSVSTAGYENFTTISADVQLGQTYSFLASSTQTTYVYDQVLVWIDFNYDGDFDDEGELVLTKNGMSPWNGSITIPNNVSTGKKRMRVRLHYNTTINGFTPNSNPCGTSTLGQVEDYMINITESGCSSIPETILASISSTEGAPGDTVELSSNVQESQGVVYQWQQSLPGMSSFEDIQNANTNTFSYTIGAEAGNTSFRLKVTCSVNQEVSYSDNVNYSASLNYCDPSELVSEFELISYVSFSDINNNSTSAIPYEDFTTLNANVFVGQTYPITVSGSNTFASDKVLVWIDFNRNGNFTDEGELVLNSATGHGPWNANITIPANAALGSTRMRVLLFDSDYNGGIPCSNQSTQDAYGQVEDYTLNIVDGTTVWNGNSWSLGEPTLTKMARIEGNLTMNTNLEAQQLKVTSSGSITIPSGFSLTVDGLIINEGYTTNFVVEHGGNLIQTTNAVNFGAITVKRNSNLMVRNDNTFWSSPVAEQSLRNFSTGTLYNRFWTYNENTNLFSSLFNNNSQDANFANGAGYAIRVTNSLPINQSIIHEGIFTGVPTNGNVNVSVVNSGIGVEDKGYNIIGNPYPSSILTSGATGFLNANPNVEALYFWTHQYPVLPQGGYAGSNYATYTTLNIDQMPAIAVGQGFIVKAEMSGSVVFNNQMRTPMETSAFSTNTSVEKHRIWLKLSKENQVLSQTLFGYMTGATNDVDSQIDGKLIDQSSTTLYNVINQEKFAVQGRSLPFADTDAVPLGINITEAGSFAIAIQNKDGLFAQGQSVFLKDNYLNLVHDLNQEYTFYSNAGESNNRFEIIYVNSVLDNTDFAKNNLTVYQNENSIIITSPTQNLKSIVLYDTLGRIIYQNKNVNNTIHSVPSASFGNQVLLLQAVTQNGQTTTKKLINN